ncbi:hypothetical protein [Tenacibaculum maritimum]|uniref:hypothetical protein n=1 Tax=Tenacibaculum maritimum TaxID=107401 RepID=UPI001E54B214|nr:hypothetical protein [Tenacibaculum maritimum]MCD9563082.1 hypothetical protein [Tenacibaculum maritimum]MCD9566606.1 hypothetical protein [Tenacibaculum maritimum]MCD9579889.1 hypothetical protein [Tenacibaculum maritimum]MCD9597268.1 hypothetical protein [Tenacibaculum maritimum]MCD9614506.1 hypothetical protein [Tenacibaculum maritimum]
MKSNKSFKDLAKQIAALKEDQLGKIKGGFAAFSTGPGLGVEGSVTNSVSVSGNCSCSCTCSSGGKEVSAL